MRENHEKERKPSKFVNNSSNSTCAKDTLISLATLEGLKAHMPKEIPLTVLESTGGT